MADRNRELVPDNQSLLKGLCSEGWYEQHVIKLKADSL